ncbi:MAG: 6-bladed beta-propeller, partial [bacterium]|nr:6-bladed beta-propeller [bacterium]
MRFVSILCVLFALRFFLTGTDIIKNPEKPLNKNSGYVLQLKEVLRIRDVGDKFYFKYPNKIKIANDGGIVVFDNKQLLKFDEKGKFLMNFFKYGQGPEEVLWISNYLLLGDTIVFHDSAQSKILFFYHKTGEFIKEFKMSGAGNETSRASLLDAYNETLYFKKSNTPDTAGKSKIIDLKNGLISVSFDGKQVKKEYEFSTKCLVIRAGDRFMSLSRTKFLHCPADDGLMYVSHTQTYELNLYNFKTNSIVLRFTRSYKRAAVTEETKKYAPGGNFGKISI